MEIKTPETITISLGQTGTAPFVAYGDESQHFDVLVYAYVIAPRENLPTLEAEVIALKAKFNIPGEKELHCRFLCSPTGRRKGGFDFLDRELVESLLYEAFELMARNQVAIRFAITDYRQHKDQYGEQIVLTDGNGQKTPHKIHRLASGGIDPKAILGGLSSHVWAISMTGQSSPSAKDCDIFVSAEHSLVKFIGDKARKAHDHYSAFIGINAPPGHIFRVEPKVTTYAESFMVQLADIVAFTCSHSGTTLPQNAFYRGLLRIYSDARCFPYDVQYDPSIAHD